MLKTAAEFVREDALRAHIEPHPAVNVRLPAKSVAEWMESMRTSEIVQRAYGERTADYTEF